MYLSKFKTKTFLIVILIIVLTLNHLQIINYVNEKYSCINQLNSENQLDLILKVRFPHVFDTLPHLRHVEKHYFKPKYILSKYRQSVSLVIGVTAMKRQNATYLYKMLDSLFEAMTNDDKSKSLIVLQLTEKNDANWTINTIIELNKLYKKEINEGLMDLVVPPKEYYPNYTNETLKDPIFNDPADRIIWRQNQNLDICFLMAYCKDRGKYYLNLEDDILSRDRFVSDILKFVKKTDIEKKRWLMLDFSQLGNIGKLIRTSDIDMFITIYLLFSPYKPIDLLHGVIFYTVACIPGELENLCTKKMNLVRVQHVPSLFQHIGMHSSLKGKIQPLRDELFKDRFFFENNKNPGAVIASSLKTFQTFTLDKCYSGENFFWGFIEKSDQMNYINFKFNKPFLLREFFIKSGHIEHPGDTIPLNSTIEIKTTNLVNNNERYFKIGNFGINGIASGTVSSDYGLIDEIQININKNISNWILINEIAFLA